MIIMFRIRFNGKIGNDHAGKFSSDYAYHTLYIYIYIYILITVLLFQNIVIELGWIRCSV